MFGSSIPTGLIRTALSFTARSLHLPSRREGVRSFKGLTQHEHKGYKVLPLMCDGVSLFLNREK
jgi:hypothetical protein